MSAATEASADLIVMGSHRKQLLLDIFVGTTIERVIRRGAFPVLMVNNEAQRRYEHVVIPVDLSDASARAIRIAQSTGIVASERATILYAFIALARAKMVTAGYDKHRIDSYIASERRLAGEEMAEYLSTNNLGSQWRLRLEEGTPMEIISRAVSDMRPDLLVMGTHGRSAVIKALVGSVIEEALRDRNDRTPIELPPLIIAEITPSADRNDCWLVVDREQVIAKDKPIFSSTAKSMQ